ncbi:MAG: hypothetical protein ETSY2_01875 [Candidatus Entotheonella gemina]|uniref:UGSC-like domain-containing protein n=1 Tax=Candidatus Entotheonella gemina TaxID=1429439 RepID=W4MFQ2_9BACT|nr:MAG: hypothetical protein ETSY2_01875 [Candidatus Entotheonella gemina]
MVDCQTWLVNPCGVASPPRYQLAQRHTIAPGTVLGLLDNGKTNAGLILEEIGAALQQQYGFAEVVHIRKPGVAHPCPEALLNELRARCTVVVNGVGD